MTDEQRSSRPIFNATLWAAASWLFFRVARSTVMIQIAALYRQSGSRLEKQPTDLRRSPRDLGDGTLVAQTQGSLDKLVRGGDGAPLANRPMSENHVEYLCPFIRPCCFLNRKLIPLSEPCVL